MSKGGRVDFSDINIKINDDTTKKDTFASKKRKETKSKRVNLLVRPSTYEKVVQLAENEGTSFNDYINIVLENLTKGV